MGRTYTVEQLAEALKDSRSIAQVLKRLGLKPAGGNYKSIKSAILQHNLDDSHLTGQSWLKDQNNHHVPRRPLEEILVENSSYKNTDYLRRRLLKEKVFEHRCASCKNTEWLGAVIPLELEHVNGVNNDNRLENLRMLCPNCHALTPTYRGRNVRGGVVERYTQST